MRPGLLVALLAVALLAAPTGAATSAGSASPSPFDDPTTTFTFTLQEDGDANVSVTVTYTLDSANETEAFRDLGREFERGATGPRIGVFERAADAASEATNREMNLSRPTRTASIHNDSDGRVGVLELSFEWRNFARVDDDGRLRVGDAFRTPNGTWLPGLREDQRLRVVGPDDYGIEDAAAARIEGGALVWEGPTTFDPGDLRVVLTGDRGVTPIPTTPTTNATTNGSGVPDEPTTGPFEQLFSSMAGGLLVAIALVVVAMYAFVSRRDGGVPTGVTAVDGGASADAHTRGDVGTHGPVADAPSEPRPETEPEPEDGPFVGVDEDLLSDEERVERLLEYNGGRMRQANIVTETGWSNAKVSQLLSSMDDTDRVDKLRIGRENLISLPDVDNVTGENGSS